MPSSPPVIHRCGTTTGASTDWRTARTLAARCGLPLATESRDVSGALGQALAQPLVALTDLPAFATSAMDGWAVSGPPPWPLHDEPALAGRARILLPEGSAVVIATGACLPTGASAVLRREHGHLVGGTLVPDLDSPLRPGSDIRPQGEECRRGDPLLPAGTEVTPAVVGLAAAAGYDQLTVHRRPTAALLVLGDELLETGLPRDGGIRDALGPMLPGMLRGCGAQVTTRHRVGDDPGSLVGALEAAAADVVITTGSTAAGPRDHLHRALADLGAELVVDTVAVRPGHPMLLARLPRPDGSHRFVVGLPGNPLAAVAGVITLAAPLLHGLGGHHADEPVMLSVERSLVGHPQDTRLQPVSLAGAKALPLPFDGPAMLRGVALADGLAVVPPGGVEPGAAVEVLSLPYR